VNPRYAAVAARAGHRCEYCGAPEALFNFPFEVEHIVPPGRGGAEVADNWALACRSCNLFKSDHVDARDPESDQVVRLYQPRSDRWDSHFRILPNGHVEGLTNVGRATIHQLQMNASAQIAARQLWLRLGLFARDG
jgi:hypothetical protein